MPKPFDGIKKIGKYPSLIIKNRKSRPKLNWAIIRYLLMLLILSFLYYGSVELSNYTKILQIFKLSGKYLILFQNNSELRPSGGFIGSFAVANLENGTIKDIYYDTNIYKRDREFISKTTITPPTPIAKNIQDPTLADKWAMRDSNWAVDFEEAAKQVAWFYENEGGERVNGVISVNATVFKNLLNIIGPINLEKYNVEINSQNFLAQTQYQIEKSYFENPQNIQINEPKTIIKDMMPEVINRIKLKQNRFKMINFVYSELNSKQIMTYFENEKLEKLVSKYGWDGKVLLSDKDYLYINNANLGSNKSSLNISENVTLKVEKANNKITNSLIISRTHNGSSIWPDGDNINYVRVLVPLGSTLISAEKDGVDFMGEITIREESGKTTLGYWNNTKVGSTQTIVLAYNLPKYFSNYSVLVQKQSGSNPDNFSLILNRKQRFDGDIYNDIILR